MHSTLKTKKDFETLADCLLSMLSFFRTGSFDPEGVPHIDIKVIVSRHQEPAGLGEGY